LMRTYVEYTHWENLTILAACTACPHASLEANVGASHGSLLDTLRHTYLSDAAWRNRVLSGAMPPLIEMAKPEQYSGSSLSFSIADLKEHWPQVTLSLMEWLESVSDSELDEMLVCRLPSGEDLTLTRAEILLHDLNHGTVHRGQVLSMLRAAHVQPPNIDVFSYYLYRNMQQQEGRASRS
jgi:uncharacterized damage-inducible protein DinB